MPKKVLIVEDNDLNLKLFRDLLGANGYRTVETKEGIEAIAMTRNVLPDLIIMDIQLPEVSGIEVTKWLKEDEDLAHIPVVAVTAFAMKGDEERIRDAGAEGYVSKPISVLKFVEAVRSLLEVAAARIEAEPAPDGCVVALPPDDDEAGADETDAEVSLSYRQPEFGKAREAAQLSDAAASV